MIRMKKLLVLVALILSGCTSPDASGVKVIVGAKLIAAPGREPVEYSVVIVENGKITAAGPQASTPVPKGSAITRGIGMTVEPEPGGDPIEPGRAANLILKGATERKMHNGEWVR
jgi:hypothetical protein